MPTPDTWAQLAPAWWQVGPTWAGIFGTPPAWAPEPSIRINGVDFTGDTVGTITIRRGRDSVYVEPSSSYADITLRSFDTAPPIQVGDRLTVRPALDQRGKPLAIPRAQSLLRPRVEQAAGAHQHMGEQQFGVDPR